MAFGGRSQRKMSEEIFDFVCTACAEDNRMVEAVKYCVECSGYCCQPCTDGHTKVQIMKKHNLLDVSQGKQASGHSSSLPEFPTERCSKHKGKLVDMYCEGHDVVGCYVCIAKDHKSCQDSHIHSIPDMIDAIFKLSDSKQTHRLLKDMMVSMETVCFDIQKMSVVDYCTLESIPYDVCCISKHEVAVACDYKIQFVSIHNKMTPTRQIKMSHLFYGIAFKDGQLYVTNYGASLHVYDMTGTQLKTITQDNAGNELFTRSRNVTFNESGNRMFVGGWNNGLVCFDGMGNYLSTFTDTDLKAIQGVCVDGRGNMFVAWCGSHNVVQFSENGKKLGVVVKRGGGLQYPHSVCFHQGLNIMFVTMEDSDVVKMYELK